MVLFSIVYIVASSQVVSPIYSFSALALSTISSAAMWVNLLCCKVYRHSRRVKCINNDFSYIVCKRLRVYTLHNKKAVTAD